MKRQVTVVMPAHNAAQYIGEAIESLIAQTHSDWRLIVVDDHSTDDTLAVVSRYEMADRRISHISAPGLKASGGPLLPRLAGAREADSEFVLPFDADDTIAPDYIEKLLETQRSTDADIVCSTLVRMGDESLTLAQSDDGATAPGRILAGRDCFRLTLTKWQLSMGGPLTRRSLFLEASADMPDDLEGAFADEYMSRLELLKARRVAFSDARYHYRANPGSITHCGNIQNFNFLHNSLHFIELAASEYGKDSEETALAHTQMFNDVVAALRMLRHSTISPAERQRVVNTLHRARRKLKQSLLQRHIGLKFRLASLLPLPLYAMLLKLRDPLREERFAKK